MRNIIYLFFILILVLILLGYFKKPISESFKGPEKSTTSKSLKPPTEQNCKFDSFIQKVLKQVSPNAGITGKCLGYINSLVHIFIRRVCKVINVMIFNTGAQTADVRYVQSAIKIVFPGELALHAVSEGTKAVTKYIVSKNSESGVTMSKQSRAGITFPPSRVSRVMRANLTSKRLGETWSMMSSVI